MLFHVNSVDNMSEPECFCSLDELVNPRFSEKLHPGHKIKNGYVDWVEPTHLAMMSAALYGKM